MRHKDQVLYAEKFGRVDFLEYQISSSWHMRCLLQSSCCCCFITMHWLRVCHQFSYPFHGDNFLCFFDSPSSRLFNSSRRHWFETVFLPSVVFQIIQIRWLFFNVNLAILALLLNTQPTLKNLIDWLTDRSLPALKLISEMSCPQLRSELQFKPKFHYVDFRDAHPKLVTSSP